MLVILSRIQFAFTVAFHFLFVPLSIGLILMMCIFELLHLVKKDDDYRKLTDFFGNIFVVNYAVGIVTGIGMSLQLGTNWSNYLTFMGDVFGGPLALEALLAFFLESTFTGIFIFKRHTLSPKFRFVTVIFITLGTTLSAMWIIMANGFMQNPVGYEISPDGSKIILTSFVALITNPYSWYTLIHTLTSAYLLGAMFVMSVTAMKLLDGVTSEEDRVIFKKGSKIGSITLLIFSLSMPIIGGSYMAFLSPLQPDKAEKMAGMVKTGLGQAINIGFLLMVVLGTLFIVLAAYTVVFFKKFMDSTTMQKIFKYIWILPYIAISVGWFVAETGRQPWVVYGLMKTADGVNPVVPVSQVWFSLITVFLMNGVLLFIVVYLSRAQIRKSINDSKYLYVLKNKGGK